MANKLPGFILKDCTLNLDGDMRIGQCSEIVLPVMEEKMEEFRNAGMIKPREVMLGYEKTESSFKETAFDPAAMRLFGVAAGRNTNIIAYGYLESEDGTESAARAEMVCRIKKVDAGSWKPGEKAESEYGVAVHSYKLFVGGEEIYALDDFEFSVGGVVRQPGRRTALRLA